MLRGQAIVSGQALLDGRNLFELQHPDFPGERLVACRNPALAKRRAHKRTALLEATTGELDKVRAMVARGFTGTLVVSDGRAAATADWVAALAPAAVSAIAVVVWVVRR